MLRLPFFYGEEGVVGAVEEGAGLLVVVPRENIGGVGVTSYIKLGLGLDPEALNVSVEYLPERKGRLAHW